MRSCSPRHVGYWDAIAAAPRFRRFLDAGRIRVAVLVTAAASATVLIAHSLVG